VHLKFEAFCAHSKNSSSKDTVAMMLSVLKRSVAVTRAVTRAHTKSSPLAPIALRNSVCSGHVSAFSSSASSSRCEKCGNRLIADSNSSSVYCENCATWRIVSQQDNPLMRQGATYRSGSTSRSISSSRDTDKGPYVEGHGPAIEGPEYAQLYGDGIGSSSSAASDITINSTPPPKPLTPRQIYDRLDDWVIGQPQVKRALSVGMHHHMKRVTIHAARSGAAGSSTGSSSSSSERSAKENDAYSLPADLLRQARCV
jgi:hypothetical protein